MNSILTLINSKEFTYEEKLSLYYSNKDYYLSYESIFIDIGLVIVCAEIFKLIKKIKND